jgi:quercetin dioxygenase-like cupin family protein
MRYTRIFNTPDGASHLDEVEVPTSATVAAENVPPLLVSAPVPATSVVFLEHMPGAERAWDPHCAPRRQLVIILSGRMRVETSDGSSRELGAGDVTLAEDTEGVGHRTIPLTDDFRFVVIPLA